MYGLTTTWTSCSSFAEKQTCPETPFRPETPVTLVLRARSADRFRYGATRHADAESDRRCAERGARLGLHVCGVLNNFHAEGSNFCKRSPGIYEVFATLVTVMQCSSDMLSILC